MRTSWLIVGIHYLLPVARILTPALKGGVAPNGLSSAAAGLSETLSCPSTMATAEAPTSIPNDLPRPSLVSAQRSSIPDSRTAARAVRSPFDLRPWRYTLSCTFCPVDTARMACLIPMNGMPLAVLVHHSHYRPLPYISSCARVQTLLHCSTAYIRCQANFCLL